MQFAGAYHGWWDGVQPGPGSERAAPDTLTLKDMSPASLRLIAARGRLMQEMPRGAMMAVRLAEAELAPYLKEPLALAAVNGPKLCVAAGPVEAVAAPGARLSATGGVTPRLHPPPPLHIQKNT